MPAPTESLRALLLTKRVVIVVGAGGVGKTTTAAALAVAAAMGGKRVLCLTIDPAKRLAESLGLKEMTTEATVVDPKRFSAAGAPFTGQLTVMMLDTKRTFDDLVVRYASSPEKAQRLLTNRLYQYVSTQLAGTHEYMAMEKLVAVQADKRYDLVVLDTPPTANALDFLDAPGKMVDALDSAAMRWFVEALETSGKLSLNILAKSAALVLRGLGRITGGGFLEAMAELIAALNDLFGGFKQRALKVEAALRSKEVAFVLVTSPSPMSIDEVLFFEARLRESNMQRAAFVVNRMHEEPPALRGLGVAQIATLFAERGVVLSEGGGERVLRAHADATAFARLDESHIARLTERVRNEAPIIFVPELASDVHDAVLLTSLARRMTE